MDLTFTFYKKDEALLTPKSRLFNCYEGIEDELRALRSESIDFKHGITAIDYLIHNCWNPDVPLPVNVILEEKDYFFHTIRYSSRQYITGLEKIVILLHEPEAILKVMSNVLIMVKDSSTASDIATAYGIPISEMTIQKIERLVHLLQEASVSGDLVMCNFSE